jgi:hypothetical chaperone protein
MNRPTLAVDFGTSNTAAALWSGGAVRRIPLEAGADTLPTAVFFPRGGGSMRIGVAAAEALVAGVDGRYMRALKSVLGTPLLHEPRLIGGKRRSLAEVIAAFLAELRSRAERLAGTGFAGVLSGRPVHFHPDAERDSRAEADLRGCYLAAGFEDVAFLREPEAAALATEGLGAAGGIGLVVDIGGGTSDFSVFARGPDGLSILASHGIRLGGTNFDHALSMRHVMPLLGHGGALRREMGPGRLPMPVAIHVDLATWEKIPFLYAPEIRRDVAQMVRLAVDARAVGRLATVLEEELGHDLMFAVERGKIAANGPDGTTRIGMGDVEPGLFASLTADGLAAVMAPFDLRLREAAAETVRMAGITPDRVATVILVGGASLMRSVGAGMQTLFPAARIARSEAFTAVVDGLALAAGRR